MTGEFSPFAFPTLCNLTAPLELDEDGIDRFGREPESRAGEFLPRRVLRERVEEGVYVEDSSSDSGSVRTSSLSLMGSVRDNSPLPRIESERAEDGREEGRQAIAVSGTGSSAPVASGCGGGLSGPSMPPMMAIPGSAKRIWSTQSSDAMRNWTKAQQDQWCLPKTSVSPTRQVPVGW